MESMAARVAAAPEKMQLRKQLCEHPFGPPKLWFGCSYFLVKGLKRVRTDWSLITRTGAGLGDVGIFVIREFVWLYADLI